MSPTLFAFLVLGAFLFCAGVTTVLARRNAVGILIGLELILNAANLNLVAFDRFGPVPLRIGPAQPALMGQGTQLPRWHADGSAQCR